MTPLVSVLVVTWNGRALLERCLPALHAQSLRDREIVIVDNGSSDGSAEVVARLCPEAAVVRSAANLHFAAGNNLGLRRCRGRYVALLNNDCQPEVDWLERAADVAEAHGCGMVATRQVSAGAPGTVDSAGIALDRAAIAWDRGGGSREDRETDDWPPLFGPSAGAGLYLRELFADVGVFDPDLIAYYEDVDLAWRARLRGWTCAEAPRARSVHLGSATSGRNAPQKRYLLARNKLWVAARCFPGPSLHRYLAAVVAYDLAALAGYLIAAPSAAVSPAARLAAVRGRVAALQGLPRQLVRRRAIQAARTAAPEDVMAAMAPLAWPRSLRARFAHLPEGGASGD